MTAPFNPPVWLRNPHLQSILPTLGFRYRLIRRRAAPLIAASREVILNCGDSVRLQSFRASPLGLGLPSNKQAAVLLHGWEGSAKSGYILGLAQQLFTAGYEVFRLNFRDHGATHHLNRELFHSCRLPEVIGAIQCIQESARKPVNLVGYSLGGNFALRVAAQAREVDLNLSRVIAVSPVLDPAATVEVLERSFYERYFVRKWSQSLLKKQSAWPDDYDFASLLDHFGKSLKNMTAELVRRHVPYPSLGTYLNGYSLTGETLTRLSVPAQIILAEDDPIVPAQGLKFISRPRSLKITLTRHGGHTGFIDRLTGPTWVEREIIAALATHTASDQA